MRLTNRVVIVTGGGSGIGRAIARRYAAEGASAVVADVDPTGGRETVAQIEQAGGKAILVDMDVTRTADTRRMAAIAFDTFGRLDVLVNNAATGGGDDILASEEAEWDRVLAIVLKSVFLCTRAVLPHMLEQRRGAIVRSGRSRGRC
jgi:3-oxoacyl-[acyl-carrier protein] reductase